MSTNRPPVATAGRSAPARGATRSPAPAPAARARSRIRAGRGRRCSGCWRSPRCCTCRSDRNGWANDFYAAAVQAGTKSWKAFFFGSFDASNFITVDKTPASLWVMELSARIFGLNHWSLLVPQALEGVAAVGLLYATVRRWFGPAAGLLAGAGAGLHAGGRADVPVQQPGRAAGAADDRGRVRADPGDRVRADPLAGAGRGAARLRVPDQDAAGVPGPAGLRVAYLVGRAAACVAAAPVADWPRWAPGSSWRRAGGSRSSS